MSACGTPNLQNVIEKTYRLVFVSDLKFSVGVLTADKTDINQQAPAKETVPYSMFETCLDAIHENTITVGQRPKQIMSGVTVKKHKY